VRNAHDAAHEPRVVGGETDAWASEHGGIFADGFEERHLAHWSAASP
jgi:hypothetical protein